MDDDLGGTRLAEVGGLLSERLLVKQVGAVHVAPGQQQVPDVQPYSLLPILQPGGVVQVRALAIPLPLLYV